MPRPRGFDEDEVVQAAVALFASRAYDGISVDDLVAHLGVHRNSLYKTFGSKRGLYLAALRWHLAHQVRPLLASIAATADPTAALTLFHDKTLRDGTPGLDLVLLATVERASEDREVATEIARVLDEFDGALAAAFGDDAELAPALTATMLGLHLRARATGTGSPLPDAAAALARRLHPPRP
jgi:TetR/AcrR family transcriptional repressor of nem operon